MAPTNYEILRAANIARNKALLAALNIEEIFPPPAKQTPKPKATKSAPKKRKAPTPEGEDSAETPAKKRQARSEDENANATGLRRSARNAGKTVDYNALPEKNVLEYAAKTSIEHERDANRPMGKRKHDP